MGRFLLTYSTPIFKLTALLALLIRPILRSPSVDNSCITFTRQIYKPVYSTSHTHLIQTTFVRMNTPYGYQARSAVPEANPPSATQTRISLPPIQVMNPSSTGYNISSLSPDQTRRGRSIAQNLVSMTAQSPQYVIQCWIKAAFAFLLEVEAHVSAGYIKLDDAARELVTQVLSGITHAYHLLLWDAAQIWTRWSRLLAS
jgi:hypothetical protein